MRTVFVLALGATLWACRPKTAPNDPQVWVATTELRDAAPRDFEGGAVHIQRGAGVPAAIEPDQSLWVVREDVPPSARSQPTDQVWIPKGTRRPLRMRPTTRK